MQAKLDLKDRLMILNNLPKVGKVPLLRVTRSLMNKLEVTKEEADKYHVIQDGGQVRWKPEGETLKEFTFLPSEFVQIKKIFTGLEAAGALPLDALTIYEKFCAEPEPVQIAEEAHR
jgi:hypothetical protein